MAELITNVEVLKNILSMAATRRVTIYYIGDSNLLRVAETASDGWYGAYQDAWYIQGRANMWATDAAGLMNGGNAWAGGGPLRTGTRGRETEMRDAGFVAVGAPGAIASHLVSVPGENELIEDTEQVSIPGRKYARLLDGFPAISDGTDKGTMMWLRQALLPAYFDYDSTLRSHVRYVEYNGAGQGQIYNSWRRAPGADVDGLPVATEDGTFANTVAVYTRSLPAEDRSGFDLRTRLFPYTLGGFEFIYQARAECTILDNTIEDSLASTGVQMVCLMPNGGRGTLWPLGILQQNANFPLGLGSDYLPELFEFCGGLNAGEDDPCAIFWIDHGGNDVTSGNNPIATSLGPNSGLDNTEAAGIWDNTLGLIDELTAICQTAGIDRKDVYFVLQGYQLKTVTPGGELLIQKGRHAQAEASRQRRNTASINISLFYDESTWASNYWEGANGSHLIDNGYQTVAEDILAAIEASPNPATDSGFLDVRFMSSSDEESAPADTWTDIGASLDDLVEGQEYIIIAAAKYRPDAAGTSIAAELRLAADGVQIGSSLNWATGRNDIDNTYKIAYAAIERHTYSAGQRIGFQGRGEPGLATAMTIGHNQILAIPVTDLGLTLAQEVAYGEDATASTLTDSWTQHATVSFSPTESSTWAIFMAGTHTRGVTAPNSNEVEFRLDINGTPTNSIGSRSTTHEITTNLLCVPMTLEPGPYTLTVEAQRSAATQADYVSSRIFAINLDKFDNSFAVSNTAVASSATWGTIASQPAFETDLDGDLVLIGTLVHTTPNAQSQNRSTMRMTVGGFETPLLSSDFHTRRFNASDIMRAGVVTMAKVGMQGGLANDITIDALADTAADVYDDVALIGFTTRYAVDDAPPPEPDLPDVTAVNVSFASGFLGIVTADGENETAIVGWDLSGADFRFLTNAVSATYNGAAAPNTMRPRLGRAYIPNTRVNNILLQNLTSTQLDGTVWYSRMPRVTG